MKATVDPVDPVKAQWFLVANSSNFLLFFFFS